MLGHHGIRRHDYTVSYDIGGLAGAYSDADGFNYRFIDPDQSIFPTSASVTVRMEDGTPLTDETCDIWALALTDRSSLRTA